jgi:hypothetical protein
MFPNAAWDGLKALCGSFMTSTISAIWQEFRHHSLDWLAISGLSIVTFFVVLLMLRFRKTEGQSHPTKADYKEDNTRDEEETVAILKKQIDDLEMEVLRFKAILSPLQVEILELVNGLKEFLEEAGSRPTSPPYHNDGSESLQEYLTTKASQGLEWFERLRARYLRLYAPRVQDMSHQLTELGFRSHDLELYSQGISGEESIEKAIHALLEAFTRMEERREVTE